MTQANLKCDAVWIQMVSNYVLVSASDPLTFLIHCIRFFFFTIFTEQPAPPGVPPDFGSLREPPKREGSKIPQIKPGGGGAGRG